MEFAGRVQDLATLERQFRLVTEGKATTQGTAVVVTGRRRVGKSRLVQEFCDRSASPYLIFQATKQRNAISERADVIAAIGDSTLVERDVVQGFEVSDWNHTLRALSLAVGDQTPSIVVLDEVPWLIEGDKEFEGALQTAWDRHLSHKPTLLILIGSDIHVMEALQDYNRPFFGRAATMRVRPLTIADVQSMTELEAASAIDAWLITGGFPEIVAQWKPGMSRTDYLEDNVHNPLSPLLMAGELSLASEFPQSTLSKSVLEAIGAGERAYSAIATKVGAGNPVPSGSLSPVLANLVAKHVICVEHPLSTNSDTKNKRYRVNDCYLRFWLAFLQRGIAESERGRGDLVLARIERSWTSWRGRAIEPVVRESMNRMLPSEKWPATEIVGGWWNRQNNPEVDLVGADRGPVASQILFLGSIKWLEGQPFGRRDYDSLVRDAVAVPGATSDTPIVAVSRVPPEKGLPLSAWWGPDHLVDAWRRF